MAPQYQNDDEYPPGHTGPTFTSIDFETANYYRTSACAIGMVRVENGVVVGTFESLIKPYPFWFHPINLGVHGISQDRCIDAPLFTDIWPQIKHWVVDQIIVAHNAPFDKSVLHHLLDHHRLSGEAKDYLCTLNLTRIEFEGLKSYRLPVVYSAMFGENFIHHNALADAHAAARIALTITAKWDPPAFHRLVRSLYSRPFNKRDSRKAPLIFSKITPDFGFEKNKQLAGKSIVFSGDIGILTRYEAVQFVVNHGGEATSGITKKTTHLVLANYNDEGKPFYKGGKYSDALENIAKGQSIIIISDFEFIEIVKAIYPNII